MEAGILGSQRGGRWRGRGSKGGNEWSGVGDGAGDPGSTDRTWWRALMESGDGGHLREKVGRRGRCQWRLKLGVEEHRARA